MHSIIKTYQLTLSDDKRQLYYEGWKKQSKQQASLNKERGTFLFCFEVL